MVNRLKLGNMKTNIEIAVSLQVVSIGLQHLGPGLLARPLSDLVTDIICHVSTHPTIASNEVECFDISCSAWLTQANAAMP